MPTRQMRVSIVSAVTVFMLMAGAAAGATFVNVTSPVGGEVVTTGVPIDITWESDATGSVDIDLMKDGDFFRSITPVGGAVNTGALPVTFATDIPTGEDYRVRITAQDTPGVFGTSAADFTVAPAGAFAVTSPAGGETMGAGEVRNITWTTTLPAQQAQILLVRNGTVARTITPTTANTGSFSWTVPADVEPGTNYRVRVGSATMQTIFAESPAVFEIEAPADLTVTFPNGGETLQAGETYPVTWTASVPGNIRLELLRADTVETVITASVAAGTGAFNWTVDEGITPGVNFRVRAVSTTDAAIFDVSDGAFTITGPPAELTVVRPNGGEVWQAGTTENITWVSAAQDTVAIELLSGAAVALVISDDAPDTGTFSWEIPLGIDEGDNYRVRVRSLTNPGMTDTSDAAFTIQTEPSEPAPVISGLLATPSPVRQGIDMSFLLTGNATNMLAGTNIAGAEYFIGIIDPGQGNATAMEAADGAFDSTAEQLSATVATGALALGPNLVSARAVDTEGVWGPLSTVNVSVVSDIPPGAIDDLEATSLGGLERVDVTIAETSGEGVGAPASNLLDDDPQTWWMTLGTIDPETEFVVFELAEPTEVAGLQLVGGRMRNLFPQSFEIEISEDGEEWERVVRQDAFRAQPRPALWQWEPQTAQFVRVSGPGLRNPRDRRYYWQIAEAAVFTSPGAPAVRLEWTAPGETLGVPAEYDVRMLDRPITARNFDVATRITAGVPDPAAPGTRQEAVVSVPQFAGQVYFAIRAIDDAGNLSDISNVASAEIAPTGFAAIAPDDEISVVADAPVTFRFSADPALRPTFIVFSNSPGFVQRAVRTDAGQVLRSVRFPVRPGTTEWTPNIGQWRSIMRLTLEDQTAYWRLEGVSREFGTIYGPPRSIHFECGEITDLAVTQPGDAEADGMLTPEADRPPVFSWTDQTVGMEQFFVDVSTDPQMPRGRQTVSLGGPRRVANDRVQATIPEWTRIRRLAAENDGQIFWRVRAHDRARLLTCASAVQELNFESGEWTLSEVDLTAAEPTVSWTTTAPGIERFNLEFSVNEQFGPTPRETLRVPARPLTDTSYTLSAGEVRRLEAFARRNNVSTLHYRVRGEDAQRAFATYSPAMTTAAP